MPRRIAAGFVLLLCLFILSAAKDLHATTVQGTVTDAAGNPAPDGSKIILRLSQEGTVTDPALLLQQPPVTCTITSGSIDAGCTVRSNDDISPAGTFYKVRIVTPSGSQLLPERNHTITGTTWDLGQQTPLASETVAATAYQIIQDDGTNVAQRTTMNFQGTGVSVADNSGTGITDITISSGAGATHQIDGAPLAAQDPINFLDTAEFDWTNPAAGDLSLALKAGFVDGLTDLAGALCGTNEILEDQGASWACIATPSGGTGAQHQVDGVNVSNNSTINFQDTAELDVTNPSAGNLQFALKTASVADSKLASSYSGVGSCAASNFANVLNDNAAPGCAQPAFSDLSGSATDAQVPDDITLTTLDTKFTLQDDLDNTKQLTLQLSGIATATTRSWTVPDVNGEVTLLGQTIEDGELASNYSGIGSCPANQAATTLNDNAAPTCLEFTALGQEIALITETSGNFVDDVLGNNGIAVTHTPGEGSDPSVAVDLLAAEDSVGATSNNSGLEFGGAGSDKLAMLQGCADNEVLKWEETGGLWQCAVDATGGAGGGYDSVAADTGSATKTSTESLKFAGTASEISTVVTTDDTTQDVLTWSLDATVAQTDVAKSWSALQTFPDDAIELVDDLDNTKKLNLQLSSIATATTRAWTVPDASGEVTLLGQTIEAGELAFDPEEEAHASEHQHGGADEVATATPGANAIPKAGAGGTLAAGWLPAHDVACATDPCVDDVEIVAAISRDTEAPAAGDISGSLSAGYTIDAGAVASTEIAAANKTFKCNFVLFDPTNGLADTDDIETISNCSRPGRPITITEVHCEVDAGTGTNINLQRDDGTPANVLTSDLNCTTSGANGTIDAAEDNFAATDKLDFVMVAAGTANRLSVLIEYTVD